MVGEEDTIGSEVQLDWQEEPEADISIHALQGTQGIHTFKLDGNVKGKHITMLVDTSSTHNFLSHVFVKSHHIPLEPCPEIKVTLVYGTTTKYTRKVKQLQWTVGSTTFNQIFLHCHWEATMPSLGLNGYRR